MNQASGKCDHNHSHHSAQVVPDRAFKIGISLNLFFVFVEIYYGVASNSLALISDALHNLTDVFGLVLAWLGIILARKATTKKFSIYAAFINNSLLMLSSIWVICEALERYRAGHIPMAMTMMIVAFIGFLINIFSAKLFHLHQHDLNVKSAYLHLMADAAVSLGVVITGGIIYYKAVFWVDPAISALISIVIIWGAWGVFKESIILLSGKTPSSVKLDLLRETIIRQPEIQDVQDIKVWALSTSENAMSAKLIASPNLSESQLKALKHKLFHDFNISEVSFS